MSIDNRGVKRAAAEDDFLGGLLTKNAESFRMLDESVRISQLFWIRNGVVHALFRQALKERTTSGHYSAQFVVRDDGVVAAHNDWFVTDEDKDGAYAFEKATSACAFLVRDLMSMRAAFEEHVRAVYAPRTLLDISWVNEDAHKVKITLDWTRAIVKRAFGPK